MLEKFIILHKHKWGFYLEKSFEKRYLLLPYMIGPDLAPIHTNPNKIFDPTQNFVRKKGKIFRIFPQPKYQANTSIKDFGY